MDALAFLLANLSQITETSQMAHNVNKIAQIVRLVVLPRSSEIHPNKVANPAHKKTPQPMFIIVLI